MNLRAIVVVLVVSVFAASASLSAAEKPQQGSSKKPGAKKKALLVYCPISGKKANSSVAIAYKGGKLQFCCPGCITRFNKDAAKYAAKANLQLVTTGQVRQVGCPLSGKKINPDIAAKLAGVNVAFCCNGCKQRVAKAKPDHQLDLVFGSGFDKAFKLKTKKDKAGKKKPAQEGSNKKQE